MNTEQAERFFALLTLAALAGSIVVLATLIGSRWNEGLRQLTASVRPFARPLAAIIAFTSMSGSLYFSEVANFTPCTLCWYQRIAMYSLAVILTIAAVRRDPGIRSYAVPLAAIGAAISLYHWLLERFPSIDAGACSATVPCDFVWFEEFRFITLPFMALTGFTSILVLLSPAEAPADRS